MQDIMDKELHAYISEILNLLCEEKVSTTNIIDSLVPNIGQIIIITNIVLVVKNKILIIENKFVQSVKLIYPH